MCLSYDERATTNFWNRKSRKGKSWAWFYKVVYATRQEVSSPCRGDKIKPGYFISSRRSTQISTDDIYSGITYGIHVFATSKAAGAWKNKAENVIRVKGYKKAFVATNSSSQQAVFMRVFVPKSEIERVMKGK